MSQVGNEINSRDPLNFQHVFSFYCSFQFSAMAFLSISTARERIKPELTLPFDHVSYQCSKHTSCLASTIRKLYSFFRFRQPKTLRSEVKSSIDIQIFLFRRHLLSISNRCGVRISTFWNVEMAEERYRRSGVTRSEMTPLIDSLNPISHSQPFKFFVNFLPFTKYTRFSISHSKFSFRVLRKEDPLTTFLSIRHSQAFSWANPHRLSH